MSVAILAMSAGTALAHANYTSACTDCHGDGNGSLTLSAVAGTAGPTTTQYTITTGGYPALGWAVFQGSNKIAGSGTTGGSVTLTNGTTYTVYGASASGGNMYARSLSVTPVAPPAGPDTTAPTTTSDAQATYTGSATIKLTANDAGGSGVAHTYYILDSGAQLEGTTISTSVIGTHTLDFWSVDASGNVEATKSASFTVAAAPVVQYYSYTYKFNLKHKKYKKLKAVLTSKATGKRYVVTISKKGVASWKNLPGGKYKLSTTGNARFKFKARTVQVGPAS
jgi:hypothetical protein